MNKILRILAPVAVIAAGVGIVAAMHAVKPEPEQNEEGPRPVSLFVDPVRREAVTLEVHTGGEVRARTQVDLVAQVSGLVVGVNDAFAAGGRFERGEGLLQIDDTDYRFAAVNARAEVARQRVLVEEIKADAEVARQQLVGRDASELGLKKPQLAQARAQLEAAEASLEQAQLNLDRTRVSLPFAGRVLAKHVDIGQFVTVGTPLATVFSTEVAEVRLPINDEQLAALGLPIGYIAGIGEGPRVDLHAAVGGIERHWNGELVRVEASVDPSTRMLYAVAEVRDPYGAAAEAAGGMPLAVGLYVNATIEGRRLADTPVLPRSALRAGDTVFVVDDGHLDIRDVEVIHTDPERAVLAAGVEPGELVVVSPVRDPVDGMAVQPLRREELARGPAGDLPGAAP